MNYAFCFVVCGFYDNIVHMSNKLTTKQERFIHEYMIDGNGSRAAIDAGYGRKSSRVIASQLLKNPNIAEKLNRGKKKIIKKTKLKAEHVINELIELAGLAKKDGKWADSIRAQELLGKHLAMFTDKVTHGDAPKRIIFEDYRNCQKDEN